MARRVDQLHHLLERQIAIFLRRQHRVTNPFEQRRQIRIVAKIDAQRQRADEEADQRFGFQPATVGLRRTDHQLLLPGHARQHQAPAASTVMNSVPPCCRLNCRSACVSSASIAIGTSPPLKDCTAGRGRSVGSVSSAGASLSVSRQYCACAANRSGVR